MKTLFLLLAIFGISIIILISSFNITDYSENALYDNNQILTIKGKVINELNSQNYKTLVIENGPSIRCAKPCPQYLNKTIEAKAKVSIYKKRQTFDVLSITFIK